MLIGFDGGDANTLPRVGSGRYGYEILKHLIPLGDSYQVYLNRQPLSDMPKGECVNYKCLSPSFLWTQIALPLDLYGGQPRPGVFFTPTHYAPRFSPIPRVITIFDLSFLKPEFQSFFRPRDLWQLKSWTAYSVAKAIHILTISEYSKRDIINFYRIPEGRITVTYLGPDILPVSKGKTARKRKKPYLLFMGTLQPRKNLERLIEAFEILKDKDLELVIAGKRGWLFDSIFAKAQSSDASQRIHFLDYVPEKELLGLFTGAEAFVLPSLYEGFGIPILNAMVSSVPIVASNVSSLPEIVGDAGVLIDPYDVTSIAAGIEKALQDRDNLVREGKRRVKKLSWELCAQRTHEVLKKVFHG